MTGGQGRIGWVLLAVGVVVAAAVGAWQLVAADDSGREGDATATLAERGRVADAIAVGLAGGQERGVETARAYLERWGEDPPGLAAIAHAAIGRGLLAQTCEAAQDGLCVRRRSADAGTAGPCGRRVWGRMSAVAREPRVRVEQARRHLLLARDASLTGLPEGTPQRRAALAAVASARLALADLAMEAWLAQDCGIEGSLEGSLQGSLDDLGRIRTAYGLVRDDSFWAPKAQARVALAHVALADALASSPGCPAETTVIEGLVGEALTSLRRCAEAVRKRRRGEPQRTLCIRLLSAVQEAGA